MLFLLATPEYNNLQSNITKVKVHLRNGIAEILDQHRDLMGQVENNIVEIESNFENKIEKSLFIVQDAVFVVSNKGLGPKKENSGTGIYVYARRVQELNSSFSGDELNKQLEQKNIVLENEKLKLSENSKDNTQKIIKSRILLLEQEIEFLKKVISITKSLK